MNRNRKEIFVEWDGPFSYRELIECKKNEDFVVHPDDIGLYQIYGSHPIYGENVLLYIGRTFDRFCKRLKDRDIIINNKDEKNIVIYLGRIFYDDSFKSNQNSLTKDIAMAESLLIHYHKPSHNSSNINSLAYSEEDYSVINIGSYKSLHCEISTRAFTKELEIFKMIDKIAKALKVDKRQIDDDGEGYGFWLNDNEWFGVLYDLWKDNTVLVLSTNKKRKGYIKYDNDEEDEYFYKPIYGDENKIVADLKKLMR